MQERSCTTPSLQLAQCFHFYFAFVCFHCNPSLLPQNKASHKAIPGPGSKQLQIIHTAFQMTPCCSRVVKADWSGLIHSKFTGEHLLQVIPSNPFQPTLMTVTENKSYLFHAGLPVPLSRPLELTAAVSDLFQVQQ